ncbi:non-ribosomal peptide synthetase [Streptomyces sp. NPDC050619]|uniref:non-ribosomal peptide synthetase n=1 Tax=Streptomyces sp. NPDC050619 TaxID=3157214 RepID=UPI00343F8BC7
MPSDHDPWARCDPADRAVIEGLQGEVVPVRPDKVLRELERRYAEGGSRIALTDGDRDWSYDELGQWVFGLRAALDERFGAGVFGVAIDRSAELVAAVQAVALSGSAYCPLGVTDPPAWRQSAAQAAGATAVLVAGDTQDFPTLTTFDVRPRYAADAGREPVTMDADATAQIIFTSGSTGRPKGVVCTHQGFANRVRWMQRAFPLTPADRVALKTPVTFDVAGWELFWPQYAGARAVVIPPEEHTSPEALITHFTEHRVTVAHFVPSMLRLWLRADGARRCPDLRLVFCSGEALTTDLVKEFARQSDAELHNLYGPTEASIDVTHARADLAPRDPVPIGRPIDNTRVYLLDRDETICPVGEVGEICLQGIGVASGYLDADTAQAARFSPLPPEPPAGWRTFRTGDLGRYTPDGQIEFCGRLDGQVKIRGQRVEPAEAESALRDHEAVLDACVVPYRSGSGRWSLAAHVVLRPGHELLDPLGALMGHLGERIPSRSVPARISVVEELPVGKHGKTDRARLPGPGRGRPGLATAFEEPATRLELLISGVWAHVLDLDEVGRFDDFHQLGGDSLAAVEISFLIAERLGLDSDDDLVADILLDGDTVANAARAAVAGGLDDGPL